MKKYFDVLRACRLFDGVGDDDLLRMLDCFGAKVAQFDKKYTIMAEGAPAKYIGIMLSGSAQVEQMDYYGNRSILSHIATSQMFAEAFACVQTPSLPVSVIANEPCEVMFINADHILHTCQNHCGFHQRLIFNLMKDLAAKTIEFHQKLEILSKRTTRDKLMAYLTVQAKQAGSRRFTIPFDRQELADYLEVERSGLSTEIGKLRQEGLLDSHRREFILLE